jgi:acyl-CoA thioester hydrolase
MTITNDPGTFHLFYKTIYVSDTDVGGVVYHANYLTYAEHARSELLSTLGIKQLAFLKSHNMGFMVAEANVEYKQSSYLDDQIIIKTTITSITNSTLTFSHVFHRNSIDSDPINIIKIRLVCIDGDKYRPVGIPENLVNDFKKYLVS